MTLDELKEVGGKLDGMTLETIHRPKRFLLQMDDNGLAYTPESTGKRRLQRWKFVERFLARFNEIRSFSPGHYKDISANAAYLLVLIKKCQAQPTP